MMNNNNISQSFLAALNRVINALEEEYNQLEELDALNVNQTRENVIKAFRDGQTVMSDYGSEQADTSFLTRNDLTEDDDEHIYLIASALAE